MSVIATELDYQIKNYSHSSYQLTQIFQQIGLSTATLNLTGGPDAIFQIPSVAMNLSQSVLNFTLTPPAAGAANSANWIYVDGISPIRQLQLYDDHGLYFCDLYDVGNYTNMIFRYTTKLEDLVTSDIPIGNVAQPYGCTEGLFPSGDPAGAITATGTVQQVARPTGWVQGQGAGVGGTTSNVGFTNYNEPAYVVSGSLNTAQPVLTYKIAMNKFKDTIFGLNKTLYFGRILYLRIVWQATTKIGYTNVGANVSNANLNPAFSTGGAGPAQNTPTAWAGNAAISNLYFYLAKEQNILIENELKNKINSPGGFRLMIPWVSQFRQNIPGSQLNNVTTRLTSAVGKRLLKIIWAPYNATESTCYAYDHNIYPTDQNAQNVGGQASTIQKVATFYTLINSTRTSMFNYNCNNGQIFNTDYEKVKYKLKGSSVFSQNEYYYNWVWTEDFTDNQSMTNKPLAGDQDTFLDGLDLTTPEGVKYDIFVTQGGTGPYINVNIYMYFVTLKELIINSSGVSFS